MHSNHENKYARIGSGDTYHAVQMFGAVGCIAFEGTRAEVGRWILANGKPYRPPVCRLCGKRSKSGAWYANGYGLGMVCFDCRDRRNPSRVIPAGKLVFA